MKRYLILVTNLFMVLTCYAYDDQELKCADREHISGLIRIINNNKHEISHRCSKFSPQLTEDVKCTVNAALKCDGSDEGCGDEESWIGGLQAFDSGSKAEIYRPICCKSDQVTIKQDKCKNVKVGGNGHTMKYFIPPNRLIHKVNCQYVKSDDGSGFKDMAFTFQDCLYAVDKKKN